MKFRPCIDIHNGKVKQIRGASLRDRGDQAEENFVSERGASYFAGLYREKGLSGGHVIVLNGKDSEYYLLSKRAALAALLAFPGGLQYGGGVNDENAGEYLDSGASHLIVTSFVFRDGSLNAGNLLKLQSAVGKERLVLDLSCRKKEDGNYYIVTDRWQKFTDMKVDRSLLRELSGECAEFLIHAVDVEGKQSGIDEELISILSGFNLIPITYAGGVRSMEDIEKLSAYGGLDFTVGSALSIFGGSLELDEILRRIELPPLRGGNDNI